MSSTSQNKPLIGTTREQITYDKNSNVVRLSDTKGISTSTRNYAVQGNQVVQMIVNGNNMGYPTYDERGNMTQNVEEGLQMSYNLCNLPKQIIAANGISVKYSYFADGTKFKAVNAAGNGFAYTGSLRWSVEDGVLTPVSVAITGGRAAYSSNGWAANYYITDHLGSVRAVTDAEGEVLDTYDYMPYGSEFTTDTDNITDYRFTGKEKQTAFGNSNIYDSFARFQNTYGRFMSIDPKAESFYHISPYTYCAGDPVNLVDPDGEAWKPTMHSNLIDGTSYYTGFEWIDESESYDENGNLKQGLFNQAIFFSDNMTFDSSEAYNIGSSTAYVYLDNGEIVTYNACTIPSSSNYPTIPEKLVEATYGLHGGKYNALRMHDFGNASSQIYLGFENPAHKGKYYIEGANIHKAGLGNKTGMTSTNKPISAGCFLIDITKWESFMSHFNSSSIVGVVASRNGVKRPINKNTCEFKIIPFTYELYD